MLHTRPQISDFNKMIDALQNSNYTEVVEILKKYPDIFQQMCALKINAYCHHHPLYAAIRGSVEPTADYFVDYMIRQNPDLLVCISDKANLLSYLITHQDNPYLVQKIINYGLDVNNQNYEFDHYFSHDHNTPLHTAIMHNRVETIKVLINNGADLTLKNDLGHTAMDVYIYNIDRVDRKIGKLLSEHGADVSCSIDGFANSLTYLINYKEWEFMANVLKYSKAIITELQLKNVLAKLKDDVSVKVKSAIKTIDKNFEKYLSDKFLGLSIDATQNLHNNKTAAALSEFFDDRVDQIVINDLDATKELVAEIDIIQSSIADI